MQSNQLILFRTLIITCNINRYKLCIRHLILIQYAGSHRGDSIYTLLINLIAKTSGNIDL